MRRHGPPARIGFPDACWHCKDGTGKLAKRLEEECSQSSMSFKGDRFQGAVRHVKHMLVSVAHAPVSYGSL